MPSYASFTGADVSSAISELEGVFGGTSVNYGRSIMLPEWIQTLASVAAIVSFVAAIIGAIYFFNAAREAKATGFKKKMFSLVNFRVYFSSGILRFLWMFATLFLIILGVGYMFEEFWVGLMIAVGFPILIRLVYEMLYLFFSMRDELVKINLNLTSDKGGKKAAVHTPAEAAYVPHPAAQKKVCPGCGEPVEGDQAFCYNCGTRL